MIHGANAPQSRFQQSRREPHIHIVRSQDCLCCIRSCQACLAQRSNPNALLSFASYSWLAPFHSVFTSSCRLCPQNSTPRERGSHSVASTRYTAALDSFLDGCCSCPNHSSRTMSHSSSGPVAWMVTCLPGRRALTC